MVVEGAACISGIMLNAGIAVQLCKEFLCGKQSGSHHEGLVTVITRPPVPDPELLCKCYLGNLFSVAEDTKFCLAGKHLFPACNAEVPAQAGKPVIRQHLLFKIL